MSNKTDKAKLDKGADRIRHARKELATVKTKLDGTLAAATKRLFELHNEIEEGTRRTFASAIEAGKILSGVRASRKGNWLKWLDENVPFSQKTAWNYIWCYENRAKLETVTNLSDAYALLKDRPGKRKRRNPAVEELVSTGIARDERDARRILKKREQGQEHDDEEAGNVTPAAIPDENLSPTITTAEKGDTRIQAQQGKASGWTPETMGENDLLDEEQTMVKQIRDYLATKPIGRCKVFVRYLRENLDCGA